MSDDENQPQNPIPEENSSPTSQEEPKEQTPENTGISEPTEASQGAQEAQSEAFEPKVESEQLPDNQDRGQNNQTPQTGENSTSEPQTAHTPANEPLEDEQVKLSHNKSKRIRQLLEMARDKIQFRKKQKLNKVMSMFLEKQKITNDEVEKLLHVSDATATRYLSQLEKEGKIKQNGRIGKGVSYSRM